jgi:hypothetical protein
MNVKIYYFQSSLTLQRGTLNKKKLKKILFIFLAASSTVLFAQSPVRLGAHFDPVISWFSTKSNDISKDGGRLGFNAGLIAEYYFAPNYALSSGFNLTRLGGDLLYKVPVNISTDAGGVLLPANTTVAYNVTYLTIPLALKLKSNEIGYFSYYAEMGFTPQVDIGSKASSTGGALNKDNVADELSLFNLSYFFGGGVEYNIGGQTSLTFGLMYNNGFVDVLSNADYKANFNSLTIRLGIMF